MPGGSGPVAGNILKAGGTNRRVTAVSASTGEAELFYMLRTGSVYYDPRQAGLYFVDSHHAPVPALVSSVLGRPLEIEQLHIDRHGFFSGARRAQLAPREAEPVLVALRLAGFEILR